MIYLDNAATTFPKPEQVYDVVDKVQRTLAVNAGRGSYRAAREASNIINDARKRIAELVKIQDESRVVHTFIHNSNESDFEWVEVFCKYKCVYLPV